MKGKKSGITVGNHEKFKSETPQFMNTSTLVYLHGSVRSARQVTVSLTCLCVCV
jgi:hypothetical protein